MNCTENFILFSKQTIDLLDNKQLSFNNWMKMLFYMQFMCGFHTRGLYSVSRQPSPRSKYSPSPPMTLTTSQSLPPSSASSVMIMSHSIDLAGLAPEKIPWLYTAFWLETLIKVTKSSLPTPLVLTQNKSATHPQLGLGLGSGLSLTPSKMARPLVFFRLHWLERCPCLSENLAGTF